MMTPAHFLVPRNLSEGSALGPIAEGLYFADHFADAVIDTAYGSPGDTDPAIISPQIEGGAIQFTRAGAGTSILDHGVLLWKAGSQGHPGGALIAEAKFRLVANLTNRAFFVGLVNEIATNSFAIRLAAGDAYGALGTNKTDLAGILFDPAGDTDNLFGVAVKNSVNQGPGGKPINLGVTPIAGTFFIVKTTVNADGDAYFYVKKEGDEDYGAPRATIKAAIRTNVLVAPTMQLIRIADTNLVDVDYWYYGGTVKVA